MGHKPMAFRNNKKRRIGRARWLVPIVVIGLCLDLAAVSVASIAFRPNQLKRQVHFEFQLVDYRFSFTVRNQSDLDIVSFKTADVQRKKRKEKDGTFETHTFAIPISHAVAVPAGESAVYAPRKVIWHDCDNMVSYVYYIKFSDGTEWGVKDPAVSEIPYFALTYETPFVSTAETEPSPVFPFHIQLSKTDYVTCITVAVLIAVVVTTGLFRLRKKKKHVAPFANPAIRTGRALRDKDGTGETK